MPGPSVDTIFFNNRPINTLQRNYKWIKVLLSEITFTRFGK